MPKEYPMFKNPIIKGASWQFGVKINRDLTSKTARIVLRKQGFADLIFSGTVTVNSVTLGRVDVYLSPAQTTAINFGDAQYFLELIDAGNVITTVLYGAIPIK